MKIDVQEIVKSFGLPAGMVALFAAILGLVGLSLDQIVDVAGTLVGVAAVVALLLNVLKWSGALPDGWAGLISAGINLAVLVVIAVVLKVNPAFNFASFDAQAGEFAQTAAVLFAYIVQITSSKSAHRFMSSGLGIKAATHSVG